jgi:hypothetical protein
MIDRPDEPEQDQPAADDLEGHVRRRAGGPAPAADDDEDDVEGHSFRGRPAEDEPPR